MSLILPTRPTKDNASETTPLRSSGSQLSPTGNKVNLFAHSLFALQMGSCEGQTSPEKKTISNIICTNWFYVRYPQNVSLDISD
jgi:hypothetical protein